jgi:hypothetical protein
VEERLCDSRSFVEVLKDGVMNRDQNRPVGRDGDGCNQQW